MAPYQYKAFISYRHISPDKEIAVKLHTLIETYVIPNSIRKKEGISKMGRVFRDEEELPLSSDLGSDIRTALEQSEWLIAVCSPDYLESKWCNAELDYFISLGRRDHILTILVNGEPEEAFPRQLCCIEKDGQLEEIEPLAGDVRAEDLKASLKKLNDEKLRILAPMLGVRFDDLRQRAQKRQIRITAVASAAVLLIVSGFLTYAVIKNRQISKQRDLALDNQMQLLIEQANESSSQGNKLLALNKLIEASSIRDTIGDKNDLNYSSALEYALYDDAFDKILTIDSNNRAFGSLTFSHNDDYLVGITNMNTACLIDASTGKIIHTVSRSDLGQLDSVGFSLDDKYFYMVDSWYNFVSVYEVESGKLFNEFNASDGTAMNIGEKVFEVDDKTLLIAKEKHLVLWDYINNKSTEILPCGDLPFEGYTRGLIIDLSPDKKDVVVGSHGYGAGMKILSLDGKKEIQLESDSQRGYSSMKYSGDGNYVAGVSASMYSVWDARDGKMILSGNYGGNESLDIMINYDGSIILTMTSDFLNAIDVSTGKVLWEKTTESNVVTEAHISSNGKYVSAGGGIEGIYDIQDGRCLYPYGSTLFSNDSSKIVSGSYYSSASILATPLYATQQYENSYKGSLFQTRRYTDPGTTISISLRHYPGEIYRTYPNNVGRKAQGYISEDLRYVAWTHEDGFIEIFDSSDLSNPTQLYCLAEHCYNSVEDLIFNGDMMASCGGYDSRCVLFNLKTGQITYVLAGSEYCHKAEFSKDGSKIIILCGYSRDVAYVYSTNSGNLLYTFRCEEGRYISDIGFDEENSKVVALLDNNDAITGIIYKNIEDMLKEARQR